MTNKAAARASIPSPPADRAAERAIRKAIKARFPEHGIIGEEYADVAGEGRYRWVIDPIDGTRAFIMGSPLWGTLIGLLDGRTRCSGSWTSPSPASASGRRGALPPARPGRQGSAAEDARLRAARRRDAHHHAPRPFRSRRGRPLQGRERRARA